MGALAPAGASDLVGFCVLPISALQHDAQAGLVWMGPDRMAAFAASRYKPPATQEGFETTIFHGHLLAPLSHLLAGPV